MTSRHSLVWIVATFETIAFTARFWLRELVWYARVPEASYVQIIYMVVSMATPHFLKIVYVA